MLEVGFFLLHERFEGNNAVVFHPHIRGELFLEPCIHLVFKSLYFYYANYSKVIYRSRSSRECRKQKENKSKILFSIYEINTGSTGFFVCLKYDVFPFLYEKN